MAEVSKSTGNYPLMTEDESILSMIDSNLNREKIEEINALWYRYSHSI